MGLSGVPVFNVNNNCSSGSTALMLARHLVQSGYDCVLAVGEFLSFFTFFLSKLSSFNDSI